MIKIGQSVTVYPHPQYEIRLDALGEPHDMAIGLGQGYRGTIVAFDDDSKEWTVEYLIGLSVKEFRFSDEKDRQVVL